MLGFPPPFRVGLLVTERCCAGCAHCWFDCRPDSGATMTLRESERYVDAASEAGVEWVSVTGGEPMLDPGLAEGVVSYASRLGLRTELVTNCAWAETPEAAEVAVKRLVDAGLSVLNLSADDFHQAAIPFGRVRNCYGAAKRLGVRMVVMTAVSRSSHLRLGEVSRLLGDEIPPPGDADASRHAAIGVESGFTPVGRGAAITRGEWLLGDAPLTGGCGAVLRDLGVKPGGELLPCCSASASLPSFSLGNLNDHGINDLLSGAWSRDLFRVLREKGPLSLGTLPEGPHVNKCHLCHDALKSL